MEIVQTVADIEANLQQLEAYLWSAAPNEREFARSLVHRGLCFVVATREDGLLFGTSRFVGYWNNCRVKHAANEEKDGRETNAAISSVLQHEPLDDAVLEKEYHLFCERIGVEYRELENTNIRRKFWRVSCASIDSPVWVSAALRVVDRGRELLGCFDRHGTETDARTTDVFVSFVEALYGAGLVMGEFNGPHFDRGPMHFIFAPGLASLSARAANVMTVRMFMHTLARGHRATDAGCGYAYFDRAYHSGGLRALIERLDQFCTFARRRQLLVLRDDPELDLIRPVGFF